MPDTTFIRQNHQPVSYTLTGLVLLCALFSSNSLAATTEPAKQAQQTETKADLQKVIEQAEKPVYPQTIKGANQAYKDKNYLDALKILVELEGDNAGKVEYDYLLGRCALETNNLNLAVSALTRVLTVDPDFAAARFELARTYYSKGVSLLARGPFEQARAEFNLVAKMNPPSELSKTIDQYQTNIDTYLKIRELQYQFFVDASAGNDSNIGSTSDDVYFSYYDYGSATQNTYQLEEGNRQQESSFTQRRVGIGIDWPLFSNNFEVFGNLMLGSKSYSKDSGYNHDWNQVQFGFRHYGESDKKTLRLRFKQTRLIEQDQVYHEQGEFMLKWAIKNSDTEAVTLWLMGGDSSYFVPGTHTFSVNYDRQGVELTQLSRDKRKSSFELLLMTGRDNPLECNNNPYCPVAYSRELLGIRAAWSIDVFNQSRFYSSLYIEKSDYDNEFFYQKRSDSRRELLFAISTAFGDNWYLRQEVRQINNDSSIGLYSFERWVASLTVGWNI